MNDLLYLHKGRRPMAQGHLNHYKSSSNINESLKNQKLLCIKSSFVITPLMNFYVFPETLTI